MTESSWLSSQDPTAMLRFLLPYRESDRVDGQLPSSRFKVSNRQLRLFAVACCHTVWPLLTDERSRHAVEVAERYADGQATEQERTVASSVVSESLHERVVFEDGAEWYSKWYSRWAARWVSRSDMQVQELIADCESLGQTPAMQAALLRCVFGNPFQACRCYCDSEVGYYCEWCYERSKWLAWNDRTIPRLAQAIYAERAWERTGILADAFEEAGCADPAILHHCRNEPSDSPHVRGCWVIDYCLGKS